MAAIRVSIYRRTGGKFYQAKWTDPASGRTKQKSTKTNIKREAERFAARLEKELNQGTYFDQSKTKWSIFRERYETEVVPGLAERTAEKISTAFNHIERILNPNLLTQVDANGISKVVKDLRADKLADISIKTYLAHLRSALNWATTMGLIPQTPIFPKFKRARAVKVMKGRPIAEGEFQRMLDAVPEVIKVNTSFNGGEEKKATVVESWRFYLRGLWFSGLRLTESLKLHWESDEGLMIDLHTHRFPMLRIRAEAEKGNKDRLMPIVPEFAQFLLTVPEEERTGFVFNPLHERSLQKRLTPLAVSKKIVDIGEKANIIVSEKGNRDRQTGKPKPRYASAHDLRRAFGARWSNKVMPLHLMELMRHESMETTLKFYVGRDAEKAAEAVWNTVAGTGDVSGDTKEIPRNERKKISQKLLKEQDLKSTPGWIRTTDLRIRSPLLYPAELRAPVFLYGPHFGRMSSHRGRGSGAGF